MKIECSQCGSTYKVNVSKIPDKGVYVKCKKCQHRILVKRQSEKQNDKTDTSKKQSMLPKRNANIRKTIPRKPAIKIQPAYDLSKRTSSQNQKKRKISTAMFVAVGFICIISSIFLGKFMFSYFTSTVTLASVAKSYTRTQYNQDFVSWLKKYLVQDYNEFGNHSPQWDSKVIKVLEKYAVYRLGLSDESFEYEIENDLKEIIDIGCNDPRVNYIYGNIIFKKGYVKKAESIVENSLKGLEQSEYSDYSRYWAVNKLISIYKQFGYSEELLDPLYTKRLTYLARAAADDRFKKGNQRHYIDILSYDWQGEWGSIPLGYEKFMEEFKQLENVDPWIDHVVRGKYHISCGWKARGGGWGNAVTSEGWEIFKSELESAANFLSKAHNMHPGLPHAATQMIQIRLAVNGVGE